MQNLILVLVGTVIIAAMVATSNMDKREKVLTLLSMIAISVFIGIKFTVEGYYIIPCIFVGSWLGGWSNRSINKRRMKILNEIMADKNISM